MAYLPSNAPIGPNSLEPSNEVCDARVRELNGQAALGRLAAYGTTPPLSSFDSPTLAVDAARILNQSQAGRASVLAGSAPQPNQHTERVDLRQIIMDAPVVVPLNSVAMCGGVARVIERPEVPQMVMPDPAPVAVRIAPNTPPVFLPPQFAPPPQFSPQYQEEPVYSGPAITAGSSAPSQWEAVSFGPGGPAANDWANPSGGLQLQAGPTQHYGYSGYAPPWGDANLMDVGPDLSEGGSWLPWLLGGAALVMLGSAVSVKRRKRRRLRR